MSSSSEVKQPSQVKDDAYDFNYDTPEEGTYHIVIKPKSDAPQCEYTIPANGKSLKDLVSDAAMRCLK